MDKKIVMFCLCAFIAIFVIPSVIFAASFDCGKATSEIEKLICSDDELSTLDESLSKAYLQALERTAIKQQTIESQRQWLKYVRNACQNTECLKNVYQIRIDELGLTSSSGIVIFFGAPGQADIPSLPLSSSPTPTIHKDFLNNLARDRDKNNDGSFDNRVVSLKYNNKYNYLLVGYESGRIDFWDANKASKKHEIRAHEYRANMLTFSSDGKSFFSSSSSEGTTRIWNAATGKMLKSIPGVGGPVGTTPNKDIYVIANSEKVHLFDLRRKILLPGDYVCEGVVTAIATDGSSGQIAIGSASGTIEIWRFSKGIVVPTLKKFSSAKPYRTGDWIVGLQFSVTGNSLYSVARFGSIDEWETNTLAKIRAVPTGLNHIYSTSFFQGKEFLALAGTKVNAGSVPGFVEVISLKSTESRMYPVKSNLAVVEFIPQLSSLIIAQGSGSIITYTLQQRK